MRSRPVEPFATYLKPSERRDEGPDPTRRFMIRADTFIRFGVGGWWGCVGVEIRRRPGRLRADHHLTTLDTAQR